MHKIYLSGPITSIGVKVAHRRFTYAEKCLEAAERRWRRHIGKPEGHDWRIVNPMRENPYKEGRRWVTCMMLDLLLLLKCDSVMMLPGWERSRGARIERRMARLLGKKIFFFHPECVKFHFSSDGGRMTLSHFPPFCFPIPGYPAP
jgi:hypothetical protein